MDPQRVKKQPPHPTPKPVIDAINTIAEYLREYGYVEVVVSDKGGAAFRLTSVYDDLLRR